MKKARFIELMAKTRDKLWYDKSELGNYICHILDYYIHNGILHDFNVMFRDARDYEKTGMFGDDRKFKNQETRFTALLLFEKMAIEEKLYLHYKEV